MLINEQVLRDSAREKWEGRDIEERNNNNKNLTNMNDTWTDRRVGTYYKNT